MSFDKQQHALAKEKGLALFRCAIDGRYCKGAKVQTGKYEHWGPRDLDTARRVFFFTLDVLTLDVDPKQSFAARFAKVMTSPKKLLDARKRKKVRK